MGGDAELFQEMVGFLRQDGQRWLQDLRTALTASDLPRVQLYSHKLKGLISTFGAARAGRAAALLEEQARSGRADSLPATAAEMEAAYAELMAALPRTMEAAAAQAVAAP